MGSAKKNYVGLLQRLAYTVITSVQNSMFSDMVSCWLKMQMGSNYA